MPYLLILLLCAYMSLVAFGFWFARRSPLLKKSDCIICLAGTRGRMGNLNDRVKTACNLYNRAVASRIVMSGFMSEVANGKAIHFTEQMMRRLIEDNRTTYTADQAAEKAKLFDLTLNADWMKKQAISLGIPEKDVSVDCIPITTIENAITTKRIMLQHGWKSGIVVTSPDHMCRTRIVFGKIFKDSKILIRSYAATSAHWHAFSWFLNRENIKVVLTELRALKDINIHITKALKADKAGKIA